MKGKRKGMPDQVKMMSRENNYNVLRMTGAAAVMYGHMFALMGTQAPALYANEVHALGFKMLMVLSGYMVTKSYLNDSNTVHYFGKRFFRIMPGLLFYTLVAIFILGPFCSTLPADEYFKHPYTWEYLYNILLMPRFQLPAVFEANPYAYAVNGSLWGLPIEVSCYILVYFILKSICRLKKRNAVFTVFTIMVYVLHLARIQFLPQVSLVLFGTDWVRALGLYPYFFAGAWAALVGKKSWYNIQAAFMLLVISAFFHSDSYMVNELLAMVVLPYGILSLGECQDPIFASFFQKVDITYGLYLWGFAVQQVSVQVLVVRMGLKISVNGMFVLAFAMSALAALLQWFLVEKPSARLMKKLLARS